MFGCPPAVMITAPQPGPHEVRFIQLHRAREAARLSAHHADRARRNAAEGVHRRNRDRAGQARRDKPLLKRRVTELHITGTESGSAGQPGGRRVTRGFGLPYHNCPEALEIRRRPPALALREELIEEHLKHRFPVIGPLILELKNQTLRGVEPVAKRTSAWKARGGWSPGRAAA